MRTRVVAAERLDHLPPDDPLARRSRRDLRRVHLAMGTRGIVARGWRALLSGMDAPLRLLELGAGDGTLALAAARHVAAERPAVQLTLLDRQDIVSAETRAGFAELGWAVSVECVDVLDWARTATESDPAWDLITATLFLHHFEREALTALLAAIAARSHAFLACEPRRDQLALFGSRLVGLIGANEVTREDAVLSVQAGFRDGELSALWPGDPDVWTTLERAAGPFGHGFSARRRGR